MQFNLDINSIHIDVVKTLIQSFQRKSFHQFNIIGLQYNLHSIELIYSPITKKFSNDFESDSLIDNVIDYHHLSH